MQKRQRLGGGRLERRAVRRAALGGEPLRAQGEHRHDAAEQRTVAHEVGHDLQTRGVCPKVSRVRGRETFGGRVPVRASSGLVSSKRSRTAVLLRRIRQSGTRQRRVFVPAPHGVAPDAKLDAEVLERVARQPPPLLLRVVPPAAKLAEDAVADKRKLRERRAPGVGARADARAFAGAHDFVHQTDVRGGVRVRARARLRIRELVRQVRAGNGELVPRGGGALRALERAALVEPPLARGGGGAVTPGFKRAKRLIVEIDAAATVAAATVARLVETIVRARAAVVPGGVVERERAVRRRQRQIGARLQNRGGFHACPRLHRARRRVARRGAGALQQRRLEPRRHGVGVQTHERVQERTAAPLREPRHAVPRLRRRDENVRRRAGRVHPRLEKVAAAEATRQHVKIRHHASHVRLGHLAVRGNRARVQTTVRRSSKGTPRGRGAIRRVSGYRLVFDVSEREPAVVPGDGAEEVFPRRRRALRRRAQSFPDVARAGVS